MSLKLGLRNKIRRSRAGGFTGLLDQSFASGATAAYSLRRLKISATKAVRVREDSGNTETDIGFSGGTLDETALLNHVGSNNGFVTKWYDQSGNGNDASNSTASQQPQIVSSGSVITENGKPGLDFDDADDYLSIGKLQSIAGSNPKSIFGVVSPDSYGDSGGGFGGAYIGVNNRTGSGTVWDHCIENGQFALRFSGNAIYDDSEENRTQRLWTTIFDGIDVFDTKIYKDGVNISRTDGSKEIIDTNETGWSIGSSFGQKNKYFDGKIQELILFSSNKSNNRTQIETELNNHYSIF